MIENKLHKTYLKDTSNDFIFWQKKTDAEKLEAVEFLRSQYIQNLPDAKQRFQRVYRITYRKPG